MAPGLRLRCALHGDVITEADADVLDLEMRHHQDVESATAPARTMDNVASLLSLAGWYDAAARARRLRDAMLDGGDHSALAADVRRLRRTVERSRILRWSLRGVGPLGHEDLEYHGLPARLGGDTYTRLLAMFDRVANGEAAPAAFPAAMLPHLVSGLDLATARLVVAGLDIHELQSGDAHHRASRA